MSSNLWKVFRGPRRLPYQAHVWVIEPYPDPCIRIGENVDNRLAGTINSPAVVGWTMAILGKRNT